MTAEQVRLAADVPRPLAKDPRCEVVQRGRWPWRLFCLVARHAWLWKPGEMFCVDCERRLRWR